MRDELAILYGYDERKFRDTIPKDDINGASQEQLIAYMTMWSHSLEKALSRDNFELGHGFRVVQYIANTLNEYDRRGFDKRALGYLNTLSVLHEFVAKHQETKYTHELERILANTLDQINSLQPKIGGVFVVDKKDKSNNDTKNFADLSAGRFAIRSFADRPVNKKDIQEVISIATKTPSVCNRQSIRVRVMYDAEIIRSVLDIQEGVSGYPTPPCLMLVTSDDSSHLGSNERNQGFVDGGLFSMSLLYALEYKKMAACPLNCMFDELREKSMRGLLGIPENEKLVMFISCGYFNGKNNVCKSFRYPVDYIMSEVDSVNTDYKIKEEPLLPHEIELQRLSSELESAHNDLETLRMPGVKISARKFAGSVRRKVHRSIPFKSTVERVKNKIRQSANKIQLYGRNRRKGGAIVTICVYNNFGNILQRFALLRFLQNHGLDFDSFDMLDPALNDGPVNQNFINFTDKYINNVEFNDFSKKSYKRYIVGSDQVWRPEHLRDQKGGVGSFFLDFLGNKKVTRVSYAASFGFSNLSEGGYDNKLIENTKSMLNRFDAISVREDSAVGLIDEMIGRSANSKVTIDPTLLLGRSEYDSLIETIEGDKDRASDVFYFVFDKTPRYDQVEGSIRRRYSSFKDIWPDSVEGWLMNIRDSKLVVAGSFHAVVFSIIFHTDFLLLEDKDEPNVRVRSLLQALGIGTDRIITSNRDFKIETLSDIKWHEVDSALANLRKDSGNWLLESLDLDDKGF